MIEVGDDVPEIGLSRPQAHRRCLTVDDLSCARSKSGINFCRFLAKVCAIAPFELLFRAPLREQSIL